MPGKENIGFVLRLPNKNGFPGRIIIFQNFSLYPNSFKQGLIKSFFPTETPPVVIIISDLAALFNSFLI